MGALVFYLGIYFEIATNLNYVITTGVVIGIRVAAIKLDLSLPKMKV